MFICYFIIFRMEYDELTLKYNPINMLGFPDYVPCKHIVDTLADVSVNNQAIHQYTRGFVCSFFIAEITSLFKLLTKISLVQVLYFVGSSKTNNCIE